MRGVVFWEYIFQENPVFFAEGDKHAGGAVYHLLHVLLQEEVAVRDDADGELDRGGAGGRAQRRRGLVAQQVADVEDRFAWFFVFSW